VNDEREAMRGDLRVRLQIAHGALSVLAQQDPRRQLATAPAPDAPAKLHELYDVPKLLESTRPDLATGLPLLIRLREQAEELQRLRDAVRDVLAFAPSARAPAPRPSYAEAQTSAELFDHLRTVFGEDGEAKS
jgi:hypothetical protein